MSKSWNEGNSQRVEAGDVETEVYIPWWRLWNSCRVPLEPLKCLKTAPCFRESSLAVVWKMDQSKTDQLEGCGVIRLEGGPPDLGQWHWKWHWKRRDNPSGNYCLWDLVIWTSFSFERFGIYRDVLGGQRTCACLDLGLELAEHSKRAQCLKVLSMGFSSIVISHCAVVGLCVLASSSECSSHSCLQHYMGSFLWLSWRSYSQGAHQWWFPLLLTLSWALSTRSSFRDHKFLLGWCLGSSKPNYCCF